MRAAVMFEAGDVRIGSKFLRGFLASRCAFIARSSDLSTIKT